MNKFTLQNERLRAKKKGNGKTTNGSISRAIQEREIKEFDCGVLPQEHDLYLGEIAYGLSVPNQHHIGN